MIPVLLITVLFLGTARVIFAIQYAPKPANALDVIVIGHQFWWEFRYPKLGIATANELHVPQDTKELPVAAFLKLTPADVMHSFWVPRLAGKTDLLPNRVNEMWFDPHVAAVYVGQCAQFCGAEHAKMLIRCIAGVAQACACAGASVVAWLPMNPFYLGWHMPRAFELTLRSAGMAQH